MSAWLGDPWVRERLALLLGAFLVSLVLVRAWRHWRRLEALVQTMKVQIGSLQSRLVDLEARAMGFERVQGAQVSDARAGHDEGVSHLLRSLLRFNEEIRSAAWSASRGADAAVVRPEEVS